MGHGDGVGGDGDGGVHQDGVGPEFHGLGGVAGRPDAGVDDDGDGGLLDDDAELVAGLEALVRPDGGAKGHDGGGADFLEALGEDGVGVDVGKDGEALADEAFGGGQGFDGVGKQVSGVGVDFELDPLGEARGGGEAREADGLVGVHGAAGVGQDQVSGRVDELEDVGEGIACAGEVGAAEGDGDDLGAACVEGVAHGLGGWKLAGAEEQA